MKASVFQSHWYIQYVVFALICCSPLPAFAQLNLSVGYNAMYIEDPISHSIIDNYNQNNSNLTQSFDEFRHLDGIVAGLRYKIDFVGLSLFWFNKKRELKSLSMDSMSEEEKFRNITFRNNNYSAGLTFFLNFFSFGGTFDYSDFKVQTSHTDIPDSYNMVNQQLWSSHFFIGIRLYKSSNMSLELRPYLHWPWSNLNFFSIEQELNPNIAAANDPANYKTHFKNLGLYEKTMETILEVSSPKVL